MIPGLRNADGLVPNRDWPVCTPMGNSTQMSTRAFIVMELPLVAALMRTISLQDDQARALQLEAVCVVGGLAG